MQFKIRKNIYKTINNCKNTKKLNQQIDTFIRKLKELYNNIQFSIISYSLSTA